MKSLQAGNGSGIGLARARSIAVTYIPADASEKEARSWLLNSQVRLSKEDRDFIVMIHLNDNLVAQWRMEGRL